MKKIILLSILFLITHFVFGQSDKRAITTSKAVLELIKEKNYDQFFNSFEDTTKIQIEEYQKKVGTDYISKTVDDFQENLSNSEINFENFNKRVVVPIEDNSDFNLVIYRFPLYGEENGQGYFETSFLSKNDFTKVYSVDLVRVQKLPQGKVIHGAEEEKIPASGEVVTENYNSTGLVKKIKYRDSTHLTIIDFDSHQNKARETRFPLNNLKYKSLVAYHKNGNIRLVTNYENGRVTGNFFEFHENGRISESGFYGSGLEKDGVWTYFDEQGRLIKTEVYEEGVLKSTE